jgi:hypothetical protein
VWLRLHTGTVVVGFIAEILRCARDHRFWNFGIEGWEIHIQTGEAVLGGVH